MDAMEHDFQLLATIDPGPKTPVGFAVNLDGGVGGNAEPTVVHQELGTANARIPAHLLVHREFHFRFFGEFHAAEGLGILVSKRLLAK